MILRSDRKMEIVVTDRIDARLCYHALAWFNATQL